MFASEPKNNDAPPANSRTAASVATTSQRPEPTTGKLSSPRRVIAAIRLHRIAASVVAVLLSITVLIDVRLFVVPTSDKPQPSDAVVVLGGATFMDRLHAAYRLIDRFPGEVLVVSIPGENDCPWKPPAATRIVCFRPDPSTTQGEARAAARLAKQNGWTSMTVVTTADQVWRARLRFSRCWAGPLHVVRAPTSMYVRLSTVPYEMAASVKAEVVQPGC